MPISFTPHNRVELAACFSDVDRSQEVEMKPSAAKLLQPHAVRTVKDLLELPQWPFSRLRIVIERRRPLIEVVIEKL